MHAVFLGRVKFSNAKMTEHKFAIVDQVNTKILFPSSSRKFSVRVDFDLVATLLCRVLPLAALKSCQVSMLTAPYGQFPIIKPTLLQKELCYKGHYEHEK